MTLLTAPNAGDMTGVVHRADGLVAGLRDGSLTRVAQAIITIVDDSFVTHPMRGGSNLMRPEWHQRRDFCVKVFRESQGDLKWTTDRALSMLRPALAAHLDHRPSPLGPRQERRTLWVPDPALARDNLIRVDDVAHAPAGPIGGAESLAELALNLDGTGDGP